MHIYTYMHRLTVTFGSSLYGEAVWLKSNHRFPCVSTASIFVHKHCDLAAEISLAVGKTQYVTENGRLVNKRTRFHTGQQRQHKQALLDIDDS